MWNLEQTEQRILRSTPIIFLITVLLLVALHFSLEPRRLAPVFNPTTSFAGEDAR